MHNTNYYFLSKTQQDVGLTKDFVNSYLLNNGTAFTSQTGYATMMFSDEMKNRDKRLAQTIRSVGYTRIDSDKPVATDLEASMTGYQIAKFIPRETQDGDGASYPGCSHYTLCRSPAQLCGSQSGTGHIDSGRYRQIHQADTYKEPECLT